MRHRKKTIKLGRTSDQREALLASLVCNLIEARRIKTTLPKAKAARSLAERMVTLGKQGSLAARRRAISTLHRPERVALLFGTIAPAFTERKGGYTRIIRLGRRSSDSAEMALLEWVDLAPVPVAKKPKPEKKEGEGKDKGEKPGKASRKKSGENTPEGGAEGPGSKKKSTRKKATTA